VLRESLWWWLDYIACNSEYSNKLCNKNIKKKIRGSKGYPMPVCTSSMEGLALRRETLRRGRRMKLETRKEKRAQ
jgi:hypothetical protein